MARPRKTETHSLSPAQAAYVLDKALADRKLTHADVDGYIVQMHEEIATIQSRLALLRENFTDGVKGVVQKVAKMRKVGDHPFPKS